MHHHPTISCNNLIANTKKRKIELLLFYPISKTAEAINLSISNEDGRHDDVFYDLYKLEFDGHQSQNLNHYQHKTNQCHLKYTST